MSSLSSNIRRVFADLISKDGFELAIPFCHSRFISLVRFVTPTLFAYLFVDDGRPSGADLTVHLWVAPPCCPDDALDSLVAGYKIQIISQYDIDDQVMAVACSRVKGLLPLCESFGPLVEANLTGPTFNRIAREVYLNVRECFCQMQADQDSGKVLRKAEALIDAGCRSQKAFDIAIDNLVELFTEGVPMIRSQQDKISRTALTRVLAELIYIHRLAEKGRRRIR